MNRNPCASGASAYELYEALESWGLSIMGGLPFCTASRVPPKAALDSNFCILNILCYNRYWRGQQRSARIAMAPEKYDHIIIRQAPTIQSAANAKLAKDLARCQLEKATNDRAVHV
jgi:hypothetical protein